MRRIINFLRRILRSFNSLIEVMLIKIFNSFFGVKGINLGSGQNWRKFGWVGIDQFDGQMLDKNSKFQFSDNSIDYIFSEAFFEHINDEDVDNLLNESSRVLKKGGKIRLITPHFEKLLNKYRDGDEKFFTEVTGVNGRPEWEKFGVKKCIENYLGHWFAAYDSKDNVNDDEFYRGPPIGIEEDIKKKANELSLKEFSEWIVSNIPKERFKKPHGHINWFNYEKFYELLKDKGFKNIKESACCKSEYSVFLNDKFDKKFRAGSSLYIEAEKT
tara:strand:- start:2289 stop:3104 length:816 start_codon:yes stop_codon:yes gene_type:complete